MNKEFKYWLNYIQRNGTFVKGIAHVPIWEIVVKDVIVESYYNRATNYIRTYRLVDGIREDMEVNTESDGNKVTKNKDLISLRKIV